MIEQDAFDEFARVSLARFGIQVDNLELEVMRAVERLYGPLRDALMIADLSDVEPEIRFDPSRAPQPPERA